MISRSEVCRKGGRALACGSSRLATQADVGLLLVFQHGANREMHLTLSSALIITPVSSLFIHAVVSDTAPGVKMGRRAV
jgi:hypothetical protein